MASGFSYGWGTVTPEEVVEAAVERKIVRIALTDCNGLYGVPRFLRACAARGIAPIVGVGISAEHSGVRGHLVLLAGSMDRYRSLCRLITDYRFSSADRRNPLRPLETLLEYPDGLVCLTGAIPFGLLPSLLASLRITRGGREIY